MIVGTRPGARRAHLSSLSTRTHATGAASTALRPVLESPRTPARVLAAFSAGIYLEIRTEIEPRVVAVVHGEAVRLPNAIVLSGALPPAEVGDDAAVGAGSIRLGRAGLSAGRWWNPAPPLGPADPALLALAARATADVLGRAARRPGLDGNGAVAMLADGCASESLVDVVTAAERLVGLGPGLTPSGDDILAGVLVALRHLGTSAGVPRAVRLADWLAAAVTYDARTRTTPISATLLHCAARGEAAPEVTAALRGMAGRHPLEPALQGLLSLGHTSGADLARGLHIGLDAVVARAAGRA
ncbi:Protein of unknown function [Sinosporangium album]|uniref:DUF2877 domain-containing protein n=1 Tax=Sinosporangium album TaxID=504805 RepID=A0A1G8BQS7_9ACTN|nr:DUF2877 domain-containing protein [Sinosporangium album]SDH35606.1 Protein of unknown function [Sinosporangium album]